MLQNVAGKLVYVVDLKTMPELPITGRDQFEQAYADALTDAIVRRMVSTPGKYAIEVDWSSTPRKWNVYKIIE